jgi:hypothetical protein
MGRNRTKWKVEPASLDYVTLAETATFAQVEPEASLPLLAWVPIGLAYKSGYSKMHRSIPFDFDS